MIEYKLCDADVGEKVIVKRLDVQGSMRRRLLDIGLVEGTEVECVGKSPLGDPCAYFIRGAVIAIRCDNSKDIIIEKSRRQKNGTY